MGKLNGKIIADALAGYSAGQDYADKQKLAALRSLTNKESLAVFLDLWKVWQSTNPSSADMASLDKLKIAHLVERRSRLDRLAHWTKSR